MKLLFTFLIPISIALFTIAGCYTILKHPAVQEDYTAQDYQHDCVSCHSDYREYPYGYFYGDYPDYWWSTPRWGHYYAYPWWWDHYWYDNNGAGDNDNETTDRSQEGEKAVRRDDLRPPYSTSSGVSTIHRGQTIPSSGTQSGTVESKGTSSSEEKKEETKTEEKKDEKKAERRGGGGPGR